VSIYLVLALAVLNGVAVFGAQMVLALYALKLGASEVAVGALAATFAIFPMLLAVSAGRLVDRFGARWPMTMGAICSGLGLLLPYLFHSLPALYAAGAMCGFAAIFFNLATQNLVGLLSSAQTRARNFSNYTLTTSTANLLAPLLGGFSIEHTDHATTCLFLAALTIFPAIVLLVSGGLLPGGTRRERGAGGGGVRAMLADPNVRRLLVTGSLVNVGVNLYQVYMPVYAHSIALPASITGMVIAMNSAAALVVRLSLPYLLRRFGQGRVLTTCFFVGALALGLIPLFHGAPMLAFVSFVFGLGMGCGQPIVMMQMFTSSRDGRSGEALGLKFTTNQLTKLVAPILFGTIASTVGLLPMFLISAGLMTFGGVFSQRATGRPDPP